MGRFMAVMIPIVLLFYGGGLLFGSQPAAEVVQPISFNHKLHATFEVSCGECHFRCEKNRDEYGEIDCDQCLDEEGIFCDEHTTCPDHKLPGLPGVEVCAYCHEGDEPETPEKSALMAYVDEGRPIPWVRVTNLSGSNVYFSHRRHAILGKIACSECHGEMETLTSPPSRPAVELGMDWCLSCHHENQRSEGCVDCHR